MKKFIDDLLRFSKVSTENIPFKKADLEHTAKTVAAWLSGIEGFGYRFDATNLSSRSKNLRISSSLL